MSKITARLASVNDSDDIFAWRNDPHTRQMSHTSDAVPLADHQRWFEHCLCSDKSVLVICVSATEVTKVAVVRFDIDAKRALVSINMAPSMRAKGLAAACLHAAIGLFSSLNHNVTCITAEIKTLNKASTRLFERVGFTQVEQKNGVLYYQLRV